jgi:GNAT superfamily N-acetyltransferase
MTNQEILKIAMAQSAIDLCAAPADFEKNENVIVTSRESEGARRYLKLPFSCQLVSYGNNVVASVLPEFREIAENYINKYPVEHLFETPHLHVLNDMLLKKGQKICFMAEDFLPDVDVLCERGGEFAPYLKACDSDFAQDDTRQLICQNSDITNRYEIRLLTQTDFADLYLPEWSNALCEARKELDVLGFGAYDNGRLIGLAACSADCETMWQIGIDVLPEYRRRGVASTLTNRLAREILKRGRVPFYCAAWSNIRSVRNAIKSGFRPAWVELTAKPIQTVEEMNAR